MVSVDTPAPSTAVDAKKPCSGFDAHACSGNTVVARRGGGSTMSTEREPSTNSLQILRLPQVCNVTGLRRSMIYQLEAEQRFPKRIKIGIRAVGWIESEVQIWVAKRIAASRTHVNFSA
jgi:prophage regulatory protein